MLSIFQALSEQIPTMPLVWPHSEVKPLPSIFYQQDHSCTNMSDKPYRILGACPHFTNQQAEVCCHFQTDRSGCTGCFQTRFGTKTLRFRSYLRCQVEIVCWLGLKSSDVKRTVIPRRPEGIRAVHVYSTWSMRNQICQNQTFCN